MKIRIIAILIIYLSFAPVIQAADATADIARAKEMVRQGDRAGALTFLDHAKMQSAAPWLYAQAMGVILYYQLSEKNSTSDTSDQRDVTGEVAVRAMAHFYDAISLNPAQTLQARRMLTDLHYSRGEYQKAEKLLNSGRVHFKGHPDFERQYRFLKTRIFEKKYTKWIYSIAALLTLLFLLKLASVYSPNRLEKTIRNEMDNDFEIELESTLENAKWSALALACSWVITLFVGPASMANILYAESVLARMTEGVVVGAGLFFFAAAFFFFGKIVLVFSSSGKIALCHVHLFGKKNVWQVKAASLSDVVIKDTYAFFIVYAIPRTIKCKQVLLRHQSGSLYPILQTPRISEAMQLAQAISQKLGCDINEVQ